MGRSTTDWRWPHFTAKELACHHCGRCEMDPRFLDRLEKLRELFHLPMAISSGYRCPVHNKKIGASPGSAHVLGRAVDVRLHGSDALDLISLALATGFSGIGVQQQLGLPMDRRFIHLDDMPLSTSRPRPHIWSY